MESEISFNKLKCFVDERKNIFDSFQLNPGTDELTAATDYDSAKTIKNIVEAALIDGVNPDTFLTRMMNECDLTDFEEISNFHSELEGGDVFILNYFPPLK